MGNPDCRGRGGEEGSLEQVCSKYSRLGVGGGGRSVGGRGSVGRGQA